MLNKYKKIVLGLWIVPPVLMIIISFILGFLGASSNMMAVFALLSVIVFLVCFIFSIIFILKGDDVGDSRLRMKEAIRFGWETAKKKFWFFFGAIIITMIIQFIPNVYNSIFHPSKGVAASLDMYALPAIDSMIISLIFWVIGMIIAIGWIKIALKLAQGEEAKISDLFSGWKLFFHYLFGSILYGLIVIAGIILLVIPGIIWQIKFSFFPYLILEGNGPIQALKKSSIITKGAKWDLFFFSFLLGMINLLGAVLLLVGMLWTIPLVAVAMAYAYVKLKSQVRI
ncbi:MAG: hypothetical protein AAB791_02990 [Patescibacteria group bacterium]